MRIKLYNKKINEAKSDAITKGVEESKKRLKDMHVVKTDKGDIDMDFLKNEVELAKAALITESPLFRPFVNMLYDVWTFDVETAATDGVRLFMNPVFMNSLEWEQKVFLLAHEIMHNLLRHLDREKQGNFNHDLFNKAGDYEINAALEEEIFEEGITKAMGGLIKKEFLGLPVEVIYEKLPPENSNNRNSKTGKGAGNGSSGQGNGNGGDGDGESSGGEGLDGTDAESKSISDKTKDFGGTGVFIDKELGDKIAQRANDGTSNEIGDKANTDPIRAWDKAMQQNKGAMQSGKGAIGNMLKEILGQFESVVPWKSILKKYMNNIYKATSIKLGNKKYLTQDYYRYYQKNESNAINEIVYLIDVSGSVSDIMLESMLSECNYIAKNLRIKKSYFVTFDSDITDVKETKMGQLPPIKLIGGGGTNFAKAFDWVNKNIKKPKNSIVITMSDGYDTIPAKPEWNKNLIWFILDNPTFNPGYGQVIKVNTKDLKKK